MYHNFTIRRFPKYIQVYIERDTLILDMNVALYSERICIQHINTCVYVYIYIYISHEHNNDDECCQ